MSNVTLSWTPPTPAADQRALKGTQLFVRIKGATAFDPLAFVAADQPPTLIDENVDDGDWEYQAVTVDNADKQSAPAFAAVTVSSAPPQTLRDPSPPTGFTAVQS